MSNFNELNKSNNEDSCRKGSNNFKKEIKKNYNEESIYPSKYSDSDNSEDEGMEDYKIGGYHPVHVG